MAVNLNSFIRKLPFFINKKSLAEPMLSNNSSSEDLFITWQITPGYHGKLLHSLVNMELASITESLPQDWLLLIRLFFARLTGPPPSKCSLTFAHSFAVFSRNFRKNNPIRRPQPSTGAASTEIQIQTPGPWCLALAKALLLHLELVSWDFRKQR